MADLIIFRKTALTGGGATAVDGISATALVGDELCFTTVSDVEYVYRMNITSGATADGINIILPVVGTVGDKRWILQTQSLASVPDLPIMTNPKAMSQSVALTAAASGSSGITVPDNDNIDFGTGDFTLVWKGSLPDWTPSSTKIIMQKYGSDGFFWTVETDGTMDLYLNTDSAVAPHVSTVATGFVDGTVHKLACVIKRGVSVTFYGDGAQIGAVVSSTVAGNINNAEPLYICGTDAVRSAGIIRNAATYNRALTAAEVLDMYRNGIPESWKWGSQTAVYSTDFSVDTGWTLANGAAISGNVLTYATNASQGVAQRTLTPTPLLSQYVALTYTVTTNDSNTTLQVAGSSYYAGGAIIIGLSSLDSTVGTHTAYIKIDGPNDRNIFTIWTAAAVSTGSIVVDDLSVRYCGATLALEPDLINGSLQWPDASTNNLHALLPVVGATQTRPAKTFTIKGINTWAGTHEPQSINSLTDDSRAILQAGCYITDIIGVITGGTIEDIIIGDGSDTDHWVAITSGLAAGTVAFTVANRISDGTNYEIVIDPDANFTGSISWTIRGIIL